MTNLQTVGVSCTIKESDTNHATPAEQDRYIAEVAQRLVGDLRRFVADARPRSEFKFWVTGPHDDPLQGLIHVHHLAAAFDMDTLPTDCDAYRVHTTTAPGDPNAAPIIIRGDTTR